MLQHPSHIATLLLSRSILLYLLNTSRELTWDWCNAKNSPISFHFRRLSPVPFLRLRCYIRQIGHRLHCGADRRNQKSQVSTDNHHERTIADVVIVVIWISGVFKKHLQNNQHSWYPPRISLNGCPSERVWAKRTQAKPYLSSTHTSITREALSGGFVGGRQQGMP